MSYYYDKQGAPISVEQYSRYDAIEGHRRTCDDIEHGRRPWFLNGDDE